MRVSKAGTRARAFSMIELVLVIAIIGILMGVVGYNMFGNVDRAAQRATEASLRTLGQGIKDYNINHSRTNPADLQALVDAQIIEPNALTDGWDTPYFYNPNGMAGKEFSLLSAGKDKKVGTADDIDYWALLAKPSN